ncbi:hypothetical protein GCM10023334_089950 [Nonomuraea thailandensis]
MVADGSPPALLNAVIAVIKAWASCGVRRETMSAISSLRRAVTSSTGRRPSGVSQHEDLPAVVRVDLAHDQPGGGQPVHPVRRALLHVDQLYTVGRRSSSEPL